MKKKKEEMDGQFKIFYSSVICFTCGAEAKYFMVIKEKTYPLP